MLQLDEWQHIIEYEIVFDCGIIFIVSFQRFALCQTFELQKEIFRSLDTKLDHTSDMNYFPNPVIRLALPNDSLANEMHTFSLRLICYTLFAILIDKVNLFTILYVSSSIVVTFYNSFSILI